MDGLIRLAAIGLLVTAVVVFAVWVISFALDNLLWIAGLAAAGVVGLLLLRQLTKPT